jgi:hypothetical protein
MKTPLTPVQKINKLKTQIKALNIRLIEGKVKNIYPVRNKIENLKNDLKIEMDNYYWENYLSI